MRPVSIVWFERFYLTALVLGLISTLINWSTISATAQAAPGASGFAGSAAFMVSVLAVSFGVSLLFWFFIARRGSKVAKWIMTVFFVLGLLGLPATLTNPMFSTGVVAMALINTLLQLAAVICLFRADTHDWFNGRKSADLDAFN